MERFKDYLGLKLSQKAFHQEYYGECSICPTTVEIVKRIDSSTISTAEIARKCGVDETVIENLRDADRCCVDSVRKIAAFFKLAPPENCLKDKVSG
jgi:hypothetical protein